MIQVWQSTVKILAELRLPGSPTEHAAQIPWPPEFPYM